MVKLTNLNEQGTVCFGHIVAFQWKGSTYNVPVAEYPHNKGKLLLMVGDLPSPLRNCYATKELYKLIDRWDGEWV
jgi:hypothetical protein